MRHRKAGVKLNMTSSHKQAMFRNMVTSLFKHDRIRTTDAKAKELRRWADHMVTLAKRGDLHARRQAMSIIREKDVVHKLFAEAVERFGSASGGYTRVIKLGRRPGDAAPVSLIELVTPESRDKKKKPAKKAKPAAPKKVEEKAEEKTAEAEEAVERVDAAPDADNVSDAPEAAEEPVEKEAAEEKKTAETQPEEAASDAAEPDDKEAEEPKDKNE
jgi:large subunit ribosomal protein L17